MVLTPCQRHRQRHRAQQALEKCEALAPEPASLHLQIYELEADVLRLSDLPNNAARVEMKRDELLPKWTPTVECYINSSNVYANPVFAWCVIWLFDVGSYDQALDWVDIAISQGQKTPGNIRREFAAFAADTVLDWARTQSEQGHSIEPYFSRTFNNVREKWRLHEEINAKWFKFAGLMLLRDKNCQGVSGVTAVDDVATLEKAEALLAQAAAFDRKIGVNTQRQKIAARIRALTSQS
ncbi:phage terminase small subunit [Photorhabdus tasmaniensis]|uniref:Terminase n=1 Tax=Photorhabdus tasmaniensis TaxID=1004159 RepID=A0ABX0GEJ8_9GAMM|nr:phage terminase small subunit [Photorhabdus tasmaniensis]NHB87181.1 terminase [Photorhabdus tasmaniensis]